jgi:hypothetical protein
MHKLQLFNSLKLKAPVKVTIETTNYKPYENHKNQEPYHKITNHIKNHYKPYGTQKSQTTNISRHQDTNTFIQETTITT